MRRQFRLETLFLLTAWAAILFVVGPPLMHWGGIPKKYWSLIAPGLWLAAVIFMSVRAYHRLRDSEL